MKTRSTRRGLFAALLGAVSIPLTMAVYATCDNYRATDASLCTKGEAGGLLPECPVGEVSEPQCEASRHGERQSSNWDCTKKQGSDKNCREDGEEVCLKKFYCIWCRECGSCIASSASYEAFNWIKKKTVNC